jgi:hypothetical protein
MLPKIRQCSILNKSALSHEELLHIFAMTNAQSSGDFMERTGTNG